MGPYLRASCSTNLFTGNALSEPRYHAHKAPHVYHVSHFWSITLLMHPSRVWSFWWLRSTFLPTTNNLVSTDCLIFSDIIQIFCRLSGMRRKDMLYCSSSSNSGKAQPPESVLIHLNSLLRVVVRSREIKLSPDSLAL